MKHMVFRRHVIHFLCSRMAHSTSGHSFEVIDGSSNLTEELSRESEARVMLLAKNAPTSSRGDQREKKGKLRILFRIGILSQKNLELFGIFFQRQ